MAVGVVKAGKNGLPFQIGYPGLRPLEGFAVLPAAGKKNFPPVDGQGLCPGVGRIQSVNNAVYKYFIHIKHIIPLVYYFPIDFNMNRGDVKKEFAKFGEN
jgi:hypothetical protein